MIHKIHFQISFGCLLLFASLLLLASCDRGSRPANMPTAPNVALEKRSTIFQPYDTPPEPIGGFAAIQRNLRYPELARKAGIEGKVILNVLVRATGQVDSVAVLKSIGQLKNAFSKAAMDAAKSVRWKPAEFKGQPVDVWVGIPVIFKLNSGTRNANLKQSSGPPSSSSSPHEELISNIHKNLSRDNIARKAGIEGKVTTEVFVASDGQLLEAKIADETRAHPILKEMALDAVKKADWRPLLKNGQPVPTHFKIRFDFEKQRTIVQLLRIQEIH